VNRAHVDHVLATIDHAIDESSFWSPDAMRWAPPEPDFDCPPLQRPTMLARVAAENGIDGLAARELVRWQSRECVRNLTAAMTLAVRAFGGLGIRGMRPSRVILDEWVEGERWDAALDPRERALQLRRNRNTGPADRRRLDGRTTRSGARS